jgi:hypothetical protein
MEPFIKNNDKLMFYKYLDKANVYFEYGSGGSTYQASLRNNINKIFSVESDLEWHNKLKEKIINKSRINFIYNDMDTKPNTWGHPGVNSNKSQWINYSDQITLLDKKTQNEIDLIMIDGRFRVACCLKSFNVINDNCLIAFDDFLNRPHYHIVLQYFDIIDKTQDNMMVILKKKHSIKDIQIPNEIIKKYTQESLSKGPK